MREGLALLEQTLGAIESVGEGFHRGGRSSSCVWARRTCSPIDARTPGHSPRKRLAWPASAANAAIPRDGHDVLAGAGGGGDEGVSLVGVDRREPCLGTNSCARAARKALR